MAVPNTPYFEPLQKKSITFKMYSTLLIDIVPALMAHSLYFRTQHDDYLKFS